ncbi:hypothetical protein V6S67_19815 [Arthrobacter sp. Soc17.1.1.1]|uniref:hypothetical protein n=1 Tax=Arthrobacter sp. Soc17.1.1.1 TaxID=3121277 RepID=UPI002FE4518C
MVSPEVEAHTEQHHADLRFWAYGDRAREAATELLIRAFSGQFATPAYPWIVDGEYKPAVDFEAIEGNLQGLLKKERRLLVLAASIGRGGVRIDLGDVIPGLDRTLLDLVLAAVAHLGVEQHHSSNLLGGTDQQTAEPPPLHWWPA